MGCQQDHLPGRDPQALAIPVQVQVLMVDHHRVEPLGVVPALNVVDHLVPGQRIVGVGLLQEPLDVPVAVQPREAGPGPGVMNRQAKNHDHHSRLA